MNTEKLDITNNIPQVSVVNEKNKKYYLSKHGNTVVYYALVNDKSKYRNRIGKSIASEIISMEDTYSQKD